MSTIKIGFGYKARRGKDTACRAIVNHFGALLDVKQYAFADELRDEVQCAVFDIWSQHCQSKFELWTPQRGMKFLCQWAGVSYDANAPASADYPYGKQRTLYQWWGTEYRRAQAPDYWVKKLAARIERERPTFAVISDMRFFNEFEFCDYRVRMDRPGFEIDDGAHHVSEHQLDALPKSRWDAVIAATTPEEVAAEAVRCFSRIYGVTRSCAPCAAQVS